MKNNINNNKKQVKTKFNWTTLLVIIPIILVCAFIIDKDIDIPIGAIITIGLAAIVSLLFMSFACPEWVFYVLVAYIPFSKILVGGFGREFHALNMTNVLIIIAVIGWIINAFKQNKRLFEKSALNLWVALFCLFGFISLLRGASFFGTDYALNFIFPLKRWLTPFFLFFVTSNLIKKQEHVKVVIVIMMIAVFIVAGMAVKDYMNLGTYSSIDRSRIGGVMDNPNMLGAFFAYYMFIFAAFLLLNMSKIQYWFLVIPFLLCFRGIQVTFSRGAYIAFIFAGLALAFFRNKFLFISCITFMIFAVINPVLLPAGMRVRLASTFDTGQVYAGSIEEIKDKSVSQRITIWKGGLALIKEHPLLGIGYGVFPHIIGLYVEEFAGRKADAHNSYITIAAEMGIPALIVFLMILMILFKKTHWLYHNTKDKFMKALALGTLAGIAGVLMANMFGSRLIEEQVSSYFWILAALITVAVNMKRKGEIA